MKVLLGGILGGIIVLSVILLFPTQIGQSQEFVQKEIIIKNNNVINSSTFDCAKQWDKIQENYKEIQEITIVTPEQSQRMMEKTDGLSMDLLKNECASTVNDWAYKTQNESSVWYMGMDWESLAFLEKKMIEDNLSPLEVGQKYLGNDGSIPTHVVPNSGGSDSKCGSGYYFDTEANLCILK